MDEIINDVLGFEEPPRKPAPIEPVYTFPNGNRIYRQDNGAGGHTYYSDSIGGGVVVWDTCLVLTEELQMAIVLENARCKIEAAGREMTGASDAVEIKENPEKPDRF